MLIGNSARTLCNPVQHFGGTTQGDRGNFQQAGRRRNRFGTFSHLAAQPRGYLAPVAWTLPDVAGDMASVNAITGAGSISGATIAGGVNLTSDLTGTGSISAELGLIVELVAALAGIGTASGTLTGTIEAAASLAGSSSVTALLGALAGMVADLTGSGTVAATATATGALSADITSGGELTPGNLAAAVWNAVAAEFDRSGSMGELMNAAGSGGMSPTLVTYLTELYRLAGLDPTRPLIVQTTERSAGSEIEQSIEESGGTVTVTRIP